ncbi:MAG: glycosyl transferase [Nitrospirae bacterium RBG_13_39_12]|nr:MAG: glycosyl transferase [Nitrospirae bacterium RBG_13_39_12]
MKLNKLSIIIPVFNEEKTISSILKKIDNVTLINNIEKEIIVVNDFSSDGTDEEIQKYILDYPDLKIQYLKHERNKGKGAAIHTGIRKANGEYIIIQDADMEYDPNEYNLLLKPVVDGFADVVYGSRFIGGNAHRIFFFWHYVGNKFLTFLSNILTNIKLTDMESCYKLFKTDIIKGIELKEQRFGFEPEITAKIAKVKNIKIYEVGISYFGRTYAEGKKISWRDGIAAIYCILKYNFIKR